MLSSTLFGLLAILASVESLALPDQRRFPTSSDNDDTVSFVDVSAFGVEGEGPVASATLNDHFRLGNAKFTSPVVLEDIFHREDAFISPQVEEDFIFPEAHPELFHSGEHQDFSLPRTRDDRALFNAKVYPTIYYPDSDLSTGNNIAPDYHVKEYPDNYRQVKEYADAKSPIGDHPAQGHQTNDRKEQDPAAPTSFASGFAFHEQHPTSHRHPDAKFSESQKVTPEFSEAERIIRGDQGFPDSGGFAVSAKQRPRNGKSVPRIVPGVERQFDSSDFFDFDYSSSSGSSFDGNYDGDYYAPGDDESTVHVGNDAAYDYDYGNSHGPDLSSDFSSFTDDFARSIASSEKSRLPQKKN